MTIGSPVYEWIKAAHWDRMSLKKFMRQTVEYKERIIAAYRLEQITESVIAKSMRKKKK